MQASKADKIATLIAQGSTEGERTAARNAMARLVRAQYGPDYRPGDVINVTA